MTITTPTLNIASISSKNALNGVSPGMTFTRALGTATQTNESGFIETVAADVMRHDYDPATLEYKGWLIEGAATNLILYSEEFENAAWTTAEVTVTDNSTISPDGTQNAAKLDDIGTDAGTSDRFGQLGTSLTGAANNTATTWYLKAGTINIVTITADFFGGAGGGYSLDIDLSDGSSLETFGPLVRHSVTDAGNGWWRVEIIKLKDVGNYAVNSYIYPAIHATLGGAADRTLTGYVYAWGAQVEDNVDAASSYIKTEGTTVTRSADAAIITDMSGINELEGTFVIEFDTASAPADFRRVFTINADPTNSYSIIGNGAGAWIAKVIDGGSEQASILLINPAVAGTDYTAAFSYKLNDVSAVITGETLGSDGLVTLPTSLDSLGIGHDPDTPSRELFGHIKSIRYWPSRLPDEELIELTL